jgi:hypothetical protein
MSQQQTLNFVPPSQSRSNSTNPPNLEGTGDTPSTKRTRNDEPERETTAPSGGAFDHVISEINDKQNKNFGLMDTGLKRYFKDAIHEITTLIQHQHHRQFSSLQNEIASLKTAVNRLERALTSNNTQQQTTNKQTTPANNTTRNTQQDRGRSRARTPNPERQPSQRQPSHAATEVHRPQVDMSPMPTSPPCPRLPIRRPPPLGRRPPPNLSPRYTPKPTARSSSLSANR